MTNGLTITIIVKYTNIIQTGNSSSIQIKLWTFIHKFSLFDKTYDRITKFILYY